MTPRLRFVNNANYLWFDKTQVLETYVFQSHIDKAIGWAKEQGVRVDPIEGDVVAG